MSTPALDVHYETAGAGPNAFVLVHGNFASWRWWRPVFARLPEGFRAVAPDLRGCGDTGAPRDPGAPYDIQQLAGDLLALVDGLSLAAFHLVGHSLGAAVAMQFALQHERRLQSLTLVSPAPAAGLAPLRDGPSRSARMLRLLDPGDARSMARLQATYRVQRAMGLNRLTLRSALAEMMPGASLEPAESEALLDDAARMSPEAMVGFLQALDRWNVERELPRLRVPTRIVAGALDALVPPALSAHTAPLLPRAELLVWPQVGHSPQVERPDAFTELLVSTARRSLRARLQTRLWLLGQSWLPSAPGAAAGPLPAVSD